jgi:hypothetical protein
VAADPYWDLGGAGASADALSIWIVQFVGLEIRVSDYIEGRGQVLAHYVTELRSRGYDRALCFLPHDGVNTNSITRLRYRDHLADAGFDVTVIPNQGRGTAMMRIEAVRRLFPQIWFNEKTCEAGIDALGYYHERRDDQRSAGFNRAFDRAYRAHDSHPRSFQRTTVLAVVSWEPPSSAPPRGYAGKSGPLRARFKRRRRWPFHYAAWLMFELWAIMTLTRRNYEQIASASADAHIV